MSLYLGRLVTSNQFKIFWTFWTFWCRGERGFIDPGFTLQVSIYKSSIILFSHPPYINHLANLIVDHRVSCWFEFEIFDKEYLYRRSSAQVGSHSLSIARCVPCQFLLTSTFSGLTSSSTGHFAGPRVRGRLLPWCRLPSVGGFVPPTLC